MKVALQFFSVRDELKRDPEKTMRAVAEMGYRYWETCSFNPDSEYNFGLDLPLDRAQRLLEELHVKIIGCHLMQQDLRPENRRALETFLDYQAAIGCESPGLAAIFVPDRDGILRCCEDMNTCAALCRARGMRFHFHNHWHEFALLDEGTYMLDVIMQNTDPALVDLELDTYWAARGGLDPVAALCRYRDRLYMIHQKDISPEARGRIDLFAGRNRYRMLADMNDWAEAVAGTDGDFTEVGTGIMDIQAIIDAGNEIGARYITLEQDHSTHPQLESVAISLQNFRRYRGLQWD